MAKGTLAFFLPGSLLTLIGAISLLGVGDGSAVDGERALGMLVTAHTAGFGVGLLGLSRWLYPDAKVDGPRSFVAGILSPLVVFLVMVMGEWTWTFAQVQVIVALVGLAMAFAMFSAWLTPTPTKLRRH